MPRVFSEVFRSINHKSFTAEKIYSMWHTLRIDVFTGTLFEIFSFLETNALFHACLVHFTRFLAQRRVLLMVWLEIPFPDVLDKLWH
jgi:hypothetical protein